MIQESETKASPSTQILPYEEEAKEREDRAGEEDIHVLRAVHRTFVKGCLEDREVCSVPSPFNPTNYVPTEAQSVRSIQQSLVCSLKDGTLVSESVEYSAAMGQNFVAPRVCVLNE